MRIEVSLAVLSADSKAVLKTHIKVAVPSRHCLPIQLSGDTCSGLFFS